MSSFPSSSSPVLYIQLFSSCYFLSAFNVNAVIIIIIVIVIIVGATRRHDTERFVKATVVKRLKISSDFLAGGQSVADFEQINDSKSLSLQSSKRGLV